MSSTTAPGNKKRRRPVTGNNVRVPVAGAGHRKAAAVAAASNNPFERRMQHQKFPVIGAFVFNAAEKPQRTRADRRSLS